MPKQLILLKQKKKMILNKHNLQNFDEWIEQARSVGGTILINKDLNWTSFDVVAKLRNLTKIKKIGHAGTLDPLASGLLIVCLGKFTKKINEFQDLGKEYLAGVKFGATTKTDDSEADEENIKEVNFTKEDLEKSIGKYIGEIEQIPPMFSAKKVNGQRLYQLARKDIEIELKPSLVKIDKIDLVSFESPKAELLVSCSKGTYIRALARDLGKDLGTGGYLYKLIRTKIGDYSYEDAVRIEDINNYLNNERL